MVPVKNIEYVGAELAVGGEDEGLKKVLAKECLQ
jgi:hypothetical protein